MPVACNMSNKSAKHPRCAESHAPTSIALGFLGMIAPLCSYYQPKQERTVKLNFNGTFTSKIDMDHQINYHLQNTLHFELMPTTPDSYEISLYTVGRKIPYKICPEIDCEEVTFIGEPDTSIIEKYNKHTEPLWSDRVKAYREWYTDESGQVYLEMVSRWRFNWSKQQLEQRKSDTRQRLRHGHHRGQVWSM